MNIHERFHFFDMFMSFAVLGIFILGLVLVYISNENDRILNNKIYKLVKKIEYYEDFVNYGTIPGK